MANETLGRLERVDLREIWASESSHFTPWLGREVNLAILGETLGLDLELEAQEKAVGPFRADLLCRDIGSGAWVLVENQLERTDHVHLGQLLTYTSGLEAATIVWVAAWFSEEHRSTLDWLNRITEERFRFFGLEVEVWRIGESPAAPKFNVVSKPNDWSRSVAQGRRSLDERELSGMRALQLDYWTRPECGSRPGRWPRARQPQAAAAVLVGVPRRPDELQSQRGHAEAAKAVGAEIYISGSRAKAFYRGVHEQREAVEEELGYGLRWEELPARNDSRIWAPLEGVQVCPPCGSARTIDYWVPIQRLAEDGAWLVGSKKPRWWCRRV